MTPAGLLRDVIRPTLATVTDGLLLPLAGERAELLLLAAAIHESGLRTRSQDGGTARSWWQIDKGGLKALTASRLGDLLFTEAVRCLFGLDGTPILVGEIVLAALGDPAMDQLACATARLLFWLDPHPLPEVGDGNGAWACYLRTFRPGKPRPEAWPADYAVASAALREDTRASYEALI